MIHPDIHTGIFPEEADELERLATGRRVVEFGTWHGFSAVVMGRVAERLVTVDWHHGDEQAGIEETLPKHISNLERFGLRDSVVTVVGQFPDVAPTLARDYFEVGFLDGKHDLASVERDLALIAGLLDSPGCILACHDYDRMLGDVRFEVIDAVERWHAEHPEWERSHVVRSLYVMVHR